MQALPSNKPITSFLTDKITGKFETMITLITILLVQAVHSDQNLKSLNFPGNQVKDFQAVKQKETIVRIFWNKKFTIAFQIPANEHL